MTIAHDVLMQANELARIGYTHHPAVHLRTLDGILLATAILAKAQQVVTTDTLMAGTGLWWRTAQFVGANYSPAADVWMGRPNRIRTLPGRGA